MIVIIDFTPNPKLTQHDRQDAVRALHPWPHDTLESLCHGTADPESHDALRSRFRQTYLANNGYDLELATARLNEGKADLFAFGRAFISNPDLVERLKTGAPLAQPNFATLYGGGAAGYTDYPPIAV